MAGSSSQLTRVNHSK